MDRLGAGLVACVIIALPVIAVAQSPDACTLLSVAEIKAALGRSDLGAPHPGRATSGGSSECRFPGAGLGDVRIILGPADTKARADFDLKPEIYAMENKRFDRVANIADGAYYFDDTLEVRVGDRIVSLFLIRTSRTEPPAVVRTALTSLAKRATDRLR